VDGLFLQKKASVLALKKYRAQQRRVQKANEETDTDDDDVEDVTNANIQGEDRSTLNVFNNRECDVVDNLARMYGKHLTQQSDRDLPRTYFPNGITGEKKKNGHEMQGVVLNILIIFMSSEHDKISRNFGGAGIGAKRLGKWILLLERLVMVEEFLKQDSISASSLKMFKRWFPMFLTLFKNVVDRKSSAQFKLLKFHLCTHFADDVKKWGLPSAYDSTTGESNHKMLKRRSRKTQRQLEFLEEQTGMRYLENLAVKSSISQISNTGFRHIDDVTSHLITGVKFSGYSYVFKNGDIYNATNNKIQDKAKWHDQELQKEIADLLANVISPDFLYDNRDMELITTFKNDGVIYRADPFYKGSAWQDWAYCDWGEGFGLVPVHLLVFIDLLRLHRDKNINGVHLKAGSGFCAVVHMVQDSLDNTFVDDEGFECDYRSHENSQIFYKARKMVNAETARPQLAVINFKSIAAPCIAVKHTLNDPSDQNYIFMKPRSEWSEILPKVMKDSLFVKEVV
jgi:hypothetical protein